MTLKKLRALNIYIYISEKIEIMNCLIPEKYIQVLRVPKCVSVIMLLQHRLIGCVNDKELKKYAGMTLKNISNYWLTSFDSYSIE